MTTHQEAAQMPRPAVSSMAWQCYNLMPGFGVSIPLLFLTSYAWLLWFAVPAVAIRLRHHARRSARR